MTESRESRPGRAQTAGAGRRHPPGPQRHAQGNESRHSAHGSRRSRQQSGQRRTAPETWTDPAETAGSAWGKGLIVVKVLLADNKTTPTTAPQNPPKGQHRTTTTHAHRHRQSRRQTAHTHTHTHTAPPALTPAAYRGKELDAQPLPKAAAADQSEGQPETDERAGQHPDELQPDGEPPRSAGATWGIPPPPYHTRTRPRFTVGNLFFFPTPPGSSSRDRPFLIFAFRSDSLCLPGTRHRRSVYFSIGWKKPPAIWAYQPGQFASISTIRDYQPRRSGALSISGTGTFPLLCAERTPRTPGTLYPLPPLQRISRQILFTRQRKARTDSPYITRPRPLDKHARPRIIRTNAETEAQGRSLEEITPFYRGRKQRNAKKKGMGEELPSRH